MRIAGLLLALLLTAGCARWPMYAPEFAVLPATVNYGSAISVRLYGAEICDYRFMGAVPGPDGSWIVRMDPMFGGIFSVPAHLAVRKGDVLGLGPGPVVMVQFVEVASSRLVLRAVAVGTPKPEPHPE
jgi:hypothetical protein